MSGGPDPVPETITATVKLNLAGEPFHAQITVPTQPFDLSRLLPIFRSLAGKVIDEAVRAEGSRGLTISCRSGCGACCRQLVPITQVEARTIRDVVEQLPEPRRSLIRGRFADARRRLEDAGLTGILDHPESLPDDEVNRFGLRYFEQGIPCPFLEEESCSIYEDRPIACREYLVTTPRENCAQPTAHTVRRVELAAKVSTALARMADDPAQQNVRWVPLILAPEWADAHPGHGELKPGPEWLKEFFELLTGSQVPAPPAAGEVEDPAGPR